MGRVKLLIAIAQLQKPVIVIVFAFEPNTLNILYQFFKLNSLISVSFVDILLTETKKRKAK